MSYLSISPDNKQKGVKKLNQNMIPPNFSVASGSAEVFVVPQGETLDLSAGFTVNDGGILEIMDGE